MIGPYRAKRHTGARARNMGAEEKRKAETAGNGAALARGLLASAILCCAPAAHADLGMSNIQLTATLVANGCSVSVGSQEQTVDMGTRASKQFTAGNRSAPPVRFVINLESCGPATSGVETVFNGNIDGDDGTLLALSSDSTAANLGIAILDKDYQRIPIGQGSTVYPLTASAGSAQLVFYGQYVATKNNVTPGTANGDVTFTLNYQ
ncbi:MULTISPECIES: fimbrial protein [unclassified Brenneria]|uniref:fimbrial protein n=1 Tax=unclassified Brenneria TaxID=2634434 RepID=UPI0020A6255E|nr:fimbrial protein [Brenneria sp. hezel4-2-4]MEE3652708.1 fimbrial protein [Brenneria sp. HEZEL_4_2_4]